MKINLGLIGYPLGHSFSPEYFANKFRAEGIEGTYRLFPLTSIEDLPAMLAEYPELDGFNVTIPYKSAIIPYLDFVDADARAIGAVNTVRIVRKQSPSGDKPYRLEGYNTDFKGFSNSLVPLVESDDEALILGTGGAAKGISYALSKLNIPHEFVSRTPDAVQGVNAPVIAYSDITAQIAANHRIIINCTPLGMYPKIDSAPDLPWNLISARHLCYDIVYNPTVTKFMQLGAGRGATVKTGLEMLHQQAEEAWKIWVGQR